MNEAANTDPSAPAPPTRAYSSALRDRQAAQTRELILDAITQLLGDRRVDEVTTRDIATTADVSERTVYRHFPDRRALLEGLSRRVQELGDVHPEARPATVDHFAQSAIRLMAALDEHYALARAEAIFNADPRHFSDETEGNTRRISAVVSDGFPQLDEREQLRITAVIRCLLSTQAWLRMREEFGVPGAESGPVVAWVIDMIIRELRAGKRPDSP